MGHGVCEEELVRLYMHLPCVHDHIGIEGHVNYQPACPWVAQLRHTTNHKSGLDTTEPTTPMIYRMIAPHGSTRA